MNMSAYPRDRSVLHRASVGAAFVGTALALLIFAAASANAQTNGTWTSTTGGSWGDSANWSASNIASGTGAVADFSKLNITGVQTVTLNSPVTSGTLLFGDTTSPAGGWTLTSSTLTLATVSGVPTISVTGLGSSVTYGTAATTISSVIAGSNGLNKSGTSALVLSGVNTYSGNTTVNGGFLVLNNASALGNSSSVTVSSGALAIGNGITIGAGKSLTNNSGGNPSYGGLTAISGGTGTWAGSVTLGSGNRIGYEQNSVLVMSGSIGGSNTLLISGNDTAQNRTSVDTRYAVVISGTTNSYTGTTAVARGVLKIGADNALPMSTTLDIRSTALSAANDAAGFDLNGFNQTVAVLNSSAITASSGSVGNASAFLTNSSATTKTFTVNQATTGTFYGIITGNLAFTKGGVGNLTLAPTLVTTASTSTTGTSTFSGDTFVSAGTLTLGNANALFGSTFDTASTGTLSLGTLSAATFGALKNSGTFTLTNSGSAFTLSVGGNNVSSSFAGRLTGLGGLTKVGSGTFTPTGSTSDYLGTTTVSAGTLLLSNSAAIPGIETAGRYSVAAGATLATGTAFSDATLQAMIATGNFAANGVLGIDTAAGNRTFANSLSGTVGLSITGGNTLTLSGSNTLGAVSVTNAILVVSNTAGLLGTGAIAMNGGRFEWNPSVNDNYGLNGRSIQLSGSGGTISNKREFTQLTYGGVSGTGALVLESGSGTLVTGANTYVGSTTIRPGALVAYTADNGFGTGTLILEGGSLRASNGTPRLLSNAVSLAGDVTFNATGSAIDNNLTFTGSTTIIAATRTLNVEMSPKAGATGIFFNGPIGDGGNGFGLVKAGTSTLIFGAANTYSGTTTLAAGRLRLDNAAALGGGGSLSFTGGTLQYSGSNTADYSARILGSTSMIAVDTNGQSVSFASALASSNVGGLTKSGSGTLTLAADNAFTGLTTISGGTLQIGTGGSSGAVTGGIVLSNAASVVFDRATDLTYAGSISGTGSLTKRGAGSLTLSGSNLFAGGISISGGSLLTTNINSLASAKAFTIDGGTLATAANSASSGISSKVSSLSIGAGGATIRSDLRFDASGVFSGSSPTSSLTYGTTSGTASDVVFVISGANTYAGGTKLESGIHLVVDNNAAFGTGTLDLAGASIRSRQTGAKTLANPVTISANTRFATAGIVDHDLWFTGPVTLSGGSRTLQVDMFPAVGHAGVFINGQIGDGGNGYGITKTGTGLLSFGGNNTYTGATTISAGTLLVNGTQAGGSLTVDAGATLGGSGVIGGDVTVNGILSPGNSPGELTLASLVLGGSSTTLMQIDGITRGTQYDAVTLTGLTGPTYGGTLSLVFGNGSAFADDTMFDLFSFTGSTSGGFSGVTSTGFYAGTWTNNNDGSFKLEQGGQTLTFSQATGDIVVVPEPTSLAIAAIGIALAGASRLRRRQVARRAG
jgi:autotransporter-associated beta strand protein